MCVNLNAIKKILKRQSLVLGIGFSVVLLVACKQESPALWIPENWHPSLTQVREQLESVANPAVPVNQQQLSQTSQALADTVDTQLFIVYVQLMQRLDPQLQTELFNEQAHWLELRTRQATAAVVSKGGSLAPLEYNKAFIEITEARLKEIQQRGENSSLSTNPNQETEQ